MIKGKINYITFSLNNIKNFYSPSNKPEYNTLLEYNFNVLALHKNEKTLLSFSYIVKIKHSKNKK